MMLLHPQSSPHPPLLNNDEPLPPQQQSKSKMIIIELPHPHPLSAHPPPQLVAAKSLILLPPKYLQCIVCAMA